MSKEKKNQAPKIDRRTRMRLAVQAGLDERTVGRFLSGETPNAHPLTVRAISDAARALGVELEAR
jgi:hypothetical protein